jgi:hypothetical protein
MARARDTSEQRVKTWVQRVAQADKVYEKWSKQYETKRLEDYWKGFQWYGVPEEDAAKKYMINQFSAGVETEKPALLFFKPQVRIEPKPARRDDVLPEAIQAAEQQARMCQDTVQTIIDDPDVKFSLETGLSLHEAFFRFGVVEVGYTADYIDNPHADKPVLKENNEEVKDSDGKPVTQPAKLTNHEQVYVKRIPASNFRVSISGKNDTTANDWVGYFEWQYLEDVKQHPTYENTATLKSSGVIKDGVRETIGSGGKETQDAMVKLWKLWDLRTGVKHVIADGHKKFLVEAEPYKYLPFAVLKFLEDLDAWYPKPLTYDWISPQDEFNEIREMQKVHRRRFTRRYTVRKGAIEDTEIEKLENGGDGVYAMHNGAPGEVPVLPVPDAPLDASIWTHTEETKNDFIMVSGVSGEQRGVAESDTATQASIVDVRSRLRESKNRTIVSMWLADICRLILMCVREKMTLDMLIQIHADPLAVQMGDQEEAQRTAATWQAITAKDLGSLDMDVAVDLASLSPVTEDAQRVSWSQVLALLTNPALCMILGSSEYLLRKTLSLYGIRAEGEIREIQGVVRQVAAMQALMGASGGATPPGGGGAAKPGQPPNGPTQLLASMERTQ